MNGQVIGQFHAALLGAFPQREDLERVVAFGLGENLNAIADRGSVSADAFYLIRWAEARELQGRLVEAAYQSNPTNPALEAFTRNYLGQLPLRLTTLNALYEALLGAFPDRESLAFLVATGLGENLDHITAGDDLQATVFRLIQWAQARGRRVELILAARAANPRHSGLKAVAENYSPLADPAAQPSVGRTPERLLLRQLEYDNPEQFAATLRQLVRAVCRVETGETLGTGFLIAPRLALTNYHVVKHLSGAEGATDPGHVQLRFGYRTDADGAPVKENLCRLAPAWLKAWGPEEKLDYAVLDLAAPPEPEAGLARNPLQIARYNWTREEAILILQHPGGNQLLQAMGSIIETADPAGWISYKVNTADGSSGAPVFNAKLQLAALHAAGGSRANRGVSLSAILDDWMRLGFVLA